MQIQIQIQIYLWLARQCGKMLRAPVNIDATYNWQTLPQIRIQIQIQLQIQIKQIQIMIMKRRSVDLAHSLGYKAVKTEATGLYSRFQITINFSVKISRISFGFNLCHFWISCYNQLFLSKMSNLFHLFKESL